MDWERRTHEVFNGLRKEFPEQLLALECLQATIRTREPGQSFTADVLFDLVEPDSKRVLVIILGCLCDRGVLRSFIRLQLPGENEASEYPELLEVPRSVTAENGSMLTVLLEHLELRYACH